MYDGSLHESSYIYIYIYTAMFGHAHEIACRLAATELRQKPLCQCSHADSWIRNSMSIFMRLIWNGLEDENAWE